jgi:hypothetical protein
MAWVTVAAAVVSTAVTGYQAYSSAQQQKDAAKANNDAAEAEANNIELENAEQLRRGNIQKRQAMASMRNQLANSGILATEGTPLLAMGEASANMDLAFADAKRQATMQADALRYQGKLGLWETDGAKTAAFNTTLAASFNNSAGAYKTTSGFSDTRAHPKTKSTNPKAEGS